MVTVTHVRLSYQEQVPVRIILDGKIVIWNAIFAHAQRRPVPQESIVVVMEHVKPSVLRHHARKQNANVIQDGRELSVKYQVVYKIIISLILLKAIIMFS